MGLQGANKSAHWDGWEMETPSSCIVFDEKKKKKKKKI